MLRSSFTSYIPFYRTPPDPVDLNINSIYMEQLWNQKYELGLSMDDGWITPPGAKGKYSDEHVKSFLLPFVVKYAFNAPGGVVYDPTEYKLWYARNILASWQYQGRVYFDGIDACVEEIRSPDEKLAFEYALGTFVLNHMEPLVQLPSKNYTQFRLFMQERRISDKRYKFVKGARAKPRFWCKTRNLTSWDYGLLLDFWSSCIVPLWARRQLRKVYMGNISVLGLNPEIVELVRTPETLQTIKILVWLILKRCNCSHPYHFRWKGLALDDYTLKEMAKLREKVRSNGKTIQEGQAGEILQVNGLTVVPGSTQPSSQAAETQP